MNKYCTNYFLFRICFALIDLLTFHLELVSLVVKKEKTSLIKFYRTALNCILVHGLLLEVEEENAPWGK